MQQQQCGASLCGVGAEVGHQFNFGPGGAEVALIETSGSLSVPRSGMYDLVQASLELLFEPYFSCVVRPCTDPNNNRFQRAPGGGENEIRILVNTQDTFWKLADFQVPFVQGKSMSFSGPSNRPLLHRQWLNAGDTLQFAITSAKGAVFAVVPISGSIGLNLSSN